MFFFSWSKQKNESSLLFVAPSPQTSMSGASKRLKQLFLEQVRSPMHQNLIKFALLDALQEDASRCQSLIQIYPFPSNPKSTYKSAGNVDPPE